MRFIIPIVIILTLASCSNPSKLLETCADKKMKNLSISESIYGGKYSRSYLLEDFQNDLTSFTLKEKLNFNHRGGTGLGAYAKFYTECEVFYKENPTTFKQKYK